MIDGLTKFGIEPRVGILDQLSHLAARPGQRTQPAQRLALLLEGRVGFFVDRGPVEESHVSVSLDPADSSAAQRLLWLVDGLATIVINNLVSVVGLASVLHR